jgi:hypothetical protein
MQQAPKGGRVMSPRSKKEYIEAIFLRYKKAPSKGKTIILNEFCATSGYHRKHAIRILRSFKRFQKPKTKKRGRFALYPPETLLKPLKRIWLAANLPCSKRLKALLPLKCSGHCNESLLPPMIDSSAPSESNIKSEVGPPPNQEPS